MNAALCEACERNKGPILKVLTELLVDPGMVLEIGSGTGQHAVHFGKHLPHLIWQTSEVQGNHTVVRERLKHAKLPNVATPITLNVRQVPWAIKKADAVFGANIAHILSWREVDLMFSGVSRVLSPEYFFILYGPFRNQGRFTSPGDEAFHEKLKAENPLMGIRDLVNLRKLASQHNMVLHQKRPMPANNFTLVWRKT